MQQFYLMDPVNVDGLLFKSQVDLEDARMNQESFLNYLNKNKRSAGR